MARLSLVDEEFADDVRELELCMSPPRPRRSFHRKSISLTSSLSLASLRYSFHYDKLPQAPIHLTVVKLDESCFAIEVGMAATVSDLKLAVERAFSHMPRKGPGKISWRHVWGHFCLCYHGEKLLDDVGLIKDYGINDGDQLQFVRHISTSDNLVRKRSRKVVDSPKQSRTSKGQESEEEEEEEEACDHVENLKCERCRDDNGSHVVRRESTFPRFFKEWFVYSRLEDTETPEYEVEPCQSRLAAGLKCCLRSLFPFCGNHRSSFPLEYQE